MCDPRKQNFWHQKTIRMHKFPKQKNPKNCQPEEEAGGLKAAPWRLAAGGGHLRSVQWPPPENELEFGFGPGGRLQVQWPPAEYEEAQEQPMDEGKTAVWRQQAAGQVKNVQWPPAENVQEFGGIEGTGRIQAQWPPSEQEEREQHLVSALEFLENFCTPNLHAFPPVKFFQEKLPAHVWYLVDIPTFHF